MRFVTGRVGGHLMTERLEAKQQLPRPVVNTTDIRAGRPRDARGRERDR